jgi:hypothetical protein
MQTLAAVCTITGRLYYHRTAEKGFKNSQEMTSASLTGHLRIFYWVTELIKPINTKQIDTSYLSLFKVLMRYNT